MAADSKILTTTIPRRLGPYEILDVLGKGAGGVVYRACHVETRQDVALKAIRQDGLTDLEALRRETHAVSRVHHPGVVRIYEQGIEEAVAWYAMEFVAGDTLERSWESHGASGASPSALQAALPVVRRLCLTLAYLHGEGIVHRDLKPRNVVVRADGNPVLVDFGFASRFGGAMSREALEAGGEVLGTFAYIAPEQARGEYVDARADLYALGCMLYELVAGRPPFMGTGWDVLQQHLMVEPLPVSERNPSVPAELALLIHALLEKERRRRFGYASDAAAILGALAPALPDERLPALRPYVYRPSFIGRDDLVSRIDGYLAAAAKGSGRFVAVAGESGIGKTRIAMEMTRCAARRGFTIVTGDCVPSEGTPGTSQARTLRLHPLRPLLDSVAAYCRDQGLEATERVLGPRGKNLVTYAPDFAKLPGQHFYPDAAPLPAQAGRARLLADLGATIEAYAHESSLLLVLDDLQWADELTLALLASLGGAFYERSPILILATYRTEEINATLREIASLPHVTRFELERMTESEIGSMVSNMLALAEAPPGLVKFLSRASEGNPFFVAEYVRAAVNSGLLTRDPATRWRLAVTDIMGSVAYQALALPHTVRELVGRRLAELGPDAQLCLEGAAVLGREFELALCGDLVGLEEKERMEAVSQLLARFVIERVRAGEFRFAHDKLREVAYFQIPDDRRRFLHERVAKMLEARSGDAADFPDLYGTLAHHWGLAGVEDKSLDYLDKAGRHALRVGAHREARGWLLEALALDERRPPGVGVLRRARWQRLLGEACLGAGELEACIEQTSSAMALLGFPVPQRSAGWLVLLGREISRQAAHRLSSRRSKPKTPLARDKMFEAALASGQLATSFYFRSHLAGAVSHSLRCVNLAERVDQPAAAGLSYAQLGYMAGAVRMRTLAQRYFERARALREQTNDLTTYAAGLYFHAMYEMALGHWERSERLGREALELLESIQNRQEAEVGRTIVANTLYFKGNFRDAQDLAQVMLESAEARSNAQHVGWGAFLTGRSLLALGNLSEACERLERGHTTLERVADFVSLIMCEGLLAKSLLLTGRPQRAFEVASVLMARLRARGTVPLAQCLDGYSSLAEVCLSLSEREAMWNAAELHRATRWSCSALRRFALLFPMAVPAALRATAREHWLAGHPRRALRAWRQAIRAAEDMQMSYEAASAHQDLARVLAPAAPYEFHRTQAHRLFTELGCEHQLKELAKT